MLTVPPNSEQMRSDPTETKCQHFESRQRFNNLTLITWNRSVCRRSYKCISNVGNVMIPIYFLIFLKKRKLDKSFYEIHVINNTKEEINVAL